MGDHHKKVKVVVLKPGQKVVVVCKKHKKHRKHRMHRMDDYC